MSKKTSNIFVDDGGAGSVSVVFVHSLAGNTQQWSAQLNHIRTTRRAIALDLRGHGRRYHLPMVITRLSQWFKIFRRLSISWVLRDSFWLVIVWGAVLLVLMQVLILNG